MNGSLLVATAVVLTALDCWAGTIGLYSEPNGTGCRVTIPQGETATVYAVGHTSGSDPGGGLVNSGEFRIVGLPAAWTAVATPAPGLALAIGDPLANGSVFAWSQLRSGVIPLFTIQITAATAASDVELKIVKHVTPSPPFGFPTTCPWFHYSCPGPCDSSGTCVDGVSLFINQDCAVAVESKSWSTVRVLYQ